MPDLFAGLADEEVLAAAAAHLRREAALPPGSPARAAAGRQYDQAKAELDRRLLEHIVARIEGR